MATRSSRTVLRKTEDHHTGTGGLEALERTKQSTKPLEKTNKLEISSPKATPRTLKVAPRRARSRKKTPSRSARKSVATVVRVLAFSQSENKENRKSARLINRADSNKTETELKKDTIQGEVTLNIPQRIYSAQYQKMLVEAGTLSNGKVYIAVSSIAPFPILGLFAAQRISHKEVVTTYGGLLKSLHDVRANAELCKTHVRRIPNSIYVRDGYEFSRCFERGDDMQDEMVKPIDERTAVGLSTQPPPELNYLSTDKYEDVRRQISNKGLGYMANTAKKALQNVRVKNVQLTRGGLHPVAMVYIANRDIEAHEEIIAPYNNHDPSVRT